jgi:hypothetical protein
MLLPSVQLPPFLSRFVRLHFYTWPTSGKVRAPSPETAPLQEHWCYNCGTDALVRKRPPGRPNCQFQTPLERALTRLKGKDCLARGSGGNRLFEPFCRGKIYADPQHVGEAVFNGDHIQQR